MMSLVLTCMYLAALLSSAAAGRGAAAAAALTEGCAEALRFLLSAAPALCFWSGVLELLERCGGADLLRRVLRPLMGKLFPVASGDREALSALCENVSANLLGLGNAATPAGIRAVRRMKILGEAAADELCLFVVLNTASLQLLPVTIAALRAAAGAAAPFDILPAVLASSCLSVLAGLLAAGVLRRVWR